MSREFSTSKFTTRLESFAPINTAIPWWIRFGEPNTDDDQDNTEIDTYMTCYLVSNPPDRLTRFARVQCNIIGRRHSIPAELEDIFQIINTQIITDCEVTRNMDGFHISDIECGETTWPFYPELNRVMMRKDYIIYYS